MKLFLFVLVAFVGIWSTHAYQCYRCAINDANCNDPFDKTKVGDANKVTATANQRCQKAKVVGGLVSRDVVDVSACPSGDNGCKSVNVPLFGKSSVCCCNSDLCNGVSSVRQQPLFVFGVISAAIMFVRHYL